MTKKTPHWRSVADARVQTVNAPPIIVVVCAAAVQKVKVAIAIVPLLDHALELGTCVTMEA